MNQDLNDKNIKRTRIIQLTPEQAREMALGSLRYKENKSDDDGWAKDEDEGAENEEGPNSSAEKVSDSSISNRRTVVMPKADRDKKNPKPPTRQTQILNARLEKLLAEEEAKLKASELSAETAILPKEQTRSNAAGFFSKTSSVKKTQILPRSALALMDEESPRPVKVTANAGLGWLPWIAILFISGLSLFNVVLLMGMMSMYASEPSEDAEENLMRLSNELAEMRHQFSKQERHIKTQEARIEMFKESLDAVHVDAPKSKAFQADTEFERQTITLNQ